MFAPKSDELCFPYSMNLRKEYCDKQKRLAFAKAQANFSSLTKSEKQCAFRRLFTTDEPNINIANKGLIEITHKSIQCRSENNKNLLWINSNSCNEQ